MPVNIVTSGSKITAYINGEIDHHNAPAVRDCIDFAIDNVQPKTVALDFSAVTFMDSSGVGLVMGRYKNARRYSAQLEVHGLSGNSEKIMRMSGLEKLVKFVK